MEEIDLLSVRAALHDICPEALRGDRKPSERVTAYEVKPGHTFDQTIARFYKRLKNNVPLEAFQFSFRWVDRRWVMFVDLRKISYYQEEIDRLGPIPDSNAPSTETN